MGRWLTRVLAFLFKEINEIRRQPRLMLSLVLGPAIVLMLFGAGFASDRPVLPTGIVVPPDIDPGLRDQIVDAVALNFQVVETGPDREAMLERLAQGDLTVVQVLPAEVQSRILDGEPPRVEFYANTINPSHEAWIQYLAYAEVNELNKAVLIQATSRLQEEARGAEGELARVQGDLDQLQSNLTPERIAQARDTSRQLRESGALELLGSPVVLATLQGSGSDADQVARDVNDLRAALDELDAALTAGDLERTRARAADLSARVSVTRTTLQQFAGVPAERVVSPLQWSYTSLKGDPYSLMIFYAPGVLALMLQHVAVTFGALALVRERMLGSFEVFQVSPARPAHLIIGKYIAYTLFIGVMAGLLVAALFYLGVPAPVSIDQLVILLLLTTLASLGLGFVISVVSRTDSQAIQLSMLVLLLSIFFSGFFIPLENFTPAVRVVGYALPVSHCIIGLQALLLSGVYPDLFTWAMLGGLAGVTFLVAAVGVARMFRQRF